PAAARDGGLDDTDPDGLRVEQLLAGRWRGHDREVDRCRGAVGNRYGPRAGRALWAGRPVGRLDVQRVRAGVQRPERVAAVGAGRRRRLRRIAHAVAVQVGPDDPAGEDPLAVLEAGAVVVH